LAQDAKPLLDLNQFIPKECLALVEEALKHGADLHSVMSSTPPNGASVEERNLPVVICGHKNLAERGAVSLGQFNHRIKPMGMYHIVKQGTTLTDVCDATIADQHSDTCVEVSLQKIAISADWDQYVAPGGNVSRNYLRYLTHEVLQCFGQHEASQSDTLQWLDKHRLHAPSYLVTDENGARILITPSELQLSYTPPLGADSSKGFGMLAQEHSCLGYGAYIWPQTEVQNPKYDPRLPQFLLHPVYQLAESDEVTTVFNTVHLFALGTTKGVRQSIGVTNFKSAQTDLCKYLIWGRKSLCTDNTTAEDPLGASSALINAASGHTASGSSHGKAYSIDPPPLARDTKPLLDLNQFVPKKCLEWVKEALRHETDLHCVMSSTPPNGASVETRNLPVVICGHKNLAGRRSATLGHFNHRINPMGMYHIVMPGTTLTDVYDATIADQRSDTCVEVSLQKIATPAKLKQYVAPYSNDSANYLRYLTHEVLQCFGQPEAPQSNPLQWLDRLYAPSYLVTAKNGVRILITPSELKLARIPPRESNDQATGLEQFSQEHSCLGYGAYIWLQHNVQEWKSDRRLPQSLLDQVKKGIYDPRLPQFLLHPVDRLTESGKVMTDFIPVSLFKPEGRRRYNIGVTNFKSAQTDLCKYLIWGRKLSAAGFEYNPSWEYSHWGWGTTPFPPSGYPHWGWGTTPFPPSGYPHCGWGRAELSEGQFQQDRNSRHGT
jgi:hypothetical protein